MKHFVEKFVEEYYGRHKYISSGAVIAAIIYLGIPYKKFEGSREIIAAIKILKKEKKKSVKSAEYLYAFIEEMRRQSARTDKTSAAQA
jgi:cation transport regulator ChaC